MLPSEEDVFQKTGKQPELPAMCLLCIRRDMHATYLAYKSVMMNPQRQISRSCFVIPPFMNLVDCPGKYYDLSKCSTISTNIDYF